MVLLLGQLDPVVDEHLEVVARVHLRAMLNVRRDLGLFLELLIDGLRHGLLAATRLVEAEDLVVGQPFSAVNRLVKALLRHQEAPGTVNSPAFRAQHQAKKQNAEDGDEDAHDYDEGPVEMHHLGMHKATNVHDGSERPEHLERVPGFGQALAVLVHE